MRAAIKEPHPELGIPEGLHPLPGLAVLISRSVCPAFLFGLLSHAGS